MIRIPCKAISAHPTHDEAPACREGPPAPRPLARRGRRCALPRPIGLTLDGLGWGHTAALVATILALAALVPATPVEAQPAVSTDGAVESRRGGFKFPDGSMQTTAAVPFGTCPTLDPSDEMIWVGGVCIDKYEASIWDAPVGGNQITGTTASDYCDPNGQDCDNIWARSVAGVVPARFITWFQAQAALANSAKRLPTNAEWQMVVRGTPDHAGPCNTYPSLSLEPTGSRLLCVSAFGAFDMVGNLDEWVADWVAFPDTCAGWGGVSDDSMCLAGASTTALGPGALIRGGAWESHQSAGPLSLTGKLPQSAVATVGFRGAR